MRGDHDIFMQAFFWCYGGVRASHQKQRSVWITTSARSRHCPSYGVFFAFSSRSRRVENIVISRAFSCAVVPKDAHGAFARLCRRQRSLACQCHREGGLHGRMGPITCPCCCRRGTLPVLIVSTLQLTGLMQPRHRNSSFRALATSATVSRNSRTRAILSRSASTSGRGSRSWAYV